MFPIKLDRSYTPNFALLKMSGNEILGTIDDEEKFEHHRWQMANAVWDRMKATDSRECQSCHTIAAMDLKEQDRYCT